MSDSSGAPRASQALTDSPWFWVMLFSAMAVVLLFVISPKYSKRQGGLELQYQARQEIARRQVEGTSAPREPGREGSLSPPAPGELLIPLWPLALLFAALFIAAAVLLYRARPAGPRSASEANPGPNR
jgi:hypothetical protein